MPRATSARWTPPSSAARADRSSCSARLARDAPALDRARPALREAELSFRPLSAADRAAARPWQLKLVPYPAGGFAQLARSSPLTELPEQQLRLLNGAYGGQGAQAEPKPGQRVKVVE